MKPREWRRGLAESKERSRLSRSPGGSSPQESSDGKGNSAAPAPGRNRFEAAAARRKRKILLRLRRETARPPIEYPLIREQEDRYDETRPAAGIANLMHKQTRSTRAFRHTPVNGPSSPAPAA
jgi:hypothetical protein